MFILPIVTAIIINNNIPPLIKSLSHLCFLFFLLWFLSNIFHTRLSLSYLSTHIKIRFLIKCNWLYGFRFMLIWRVSTTSRPFLSAFQKVRKDFSCSTHHCISRTLSLIHTLIVPCLLHYSLLVHFLRTSPFHFLTFLPFFALFSPLYILFSPDFPPSLLSHCRWNTFTAYVTVQSKCCPRVFLHRWSPPTPPRCWQLWYRHIQIRFVLCYIDVIVWHVTRY